MRQVGTRRLPTIAKQASGLLLIEGARFSQTIAHLSPTTFVPKGMYRFASHEQANQHAQDCLVQGMGLLAVERANVVG